MTTERTSNKKVVLGVSSVEIERLVKLSAKVRGRYIAKLLDLGGDGHLVLKESELVDLRRTRESHEELRRLNVLKTAISNGEITVMQFGALLLTRVFG